MDQLAHICGLRKAARRVLAGAGVVLALVITSGCADYLPFSKGALEGEVALPPASYTDVARQEIIQFETNPSEPYSVNLWVIGEGERLYVYAGDSETTWVQNIAADPNVRIKLGAAIYELRATRVTDAEEFEWFAKAWDEKYGHRPMNENVDETWLMRLAPRT